MPDPLRFLSAVGRPRPARRHGPDRRPGRRRSLVAAAVALSLAAAGCAPTTSTPTPSASASASAVSTGGPSTVEPAPTVGPSVVPSASTGGTAFECPLVATTFVPPTNRLTGVAVKPLEGYDEVAFTFGPGAAGGGSTPSLAVGPATPPFVHGGSGAPLLVAGARFVQFTFRDMIVADEGGAPSYAGSVDLRPAGGAVAEVVQAEAFEGVVRWIVGTTEPGCARVAVDAAGSRVVLDVRRP